MYAVNHSRPYGSQRSDARKAINKAKAKLHQDILESNFSQVHRLQAKIVRLEALDAELLEICKQEFAKEKPVISETKREIDDSWMYDFIEYDEED